MEKLKIKNFEVKDGRILAKFLKTTGLKQTLFDVMFPKDNPNLPKNWIELRSHLQSNYDMSDDDFRAFQKETSGNFNMALARYASDFPAPAGEDTGKLIVDLLVDIFADDVKYEETVSLFAYLFQCERAVIENMPIPEMVQLVMQLMQDSGFFEQLQPSTPQTETVAEPQV